jgi:hypothetical protein
MKTNINSLVCEQICKFNSGGYEIQRCKYNINDVIIFEETFFPINPFKNSVVFYIVDLVLPMKTIIENGEMSDCGYFEIGFGNPHFKNLTDAVEFIENYKK